MISIYFEGYWALFFKVIGLYSKIKNTLPRQWGFLFQNEMANTKIQRWAVIIAEFGADIQYREGKNNIRADMLSRLHCPQINPVEVKNYIEPQEGSVTWDLPLYFDGINRDQLIET